MFLLSGHYKVTTEVVVSFSIFYYEFRCFRKYALDFDLLFTRDIALKKNSKPKRPGRDGVAQTTIR